MDLKERDQQEKEMSSMISELAMGTEEDNEDIDKMMAQLESEVSDQKMMEVNNVAVKQ